MALMASTRREADTQSFPLALYILTPLLALGLQSFVTLHFAHFATLDLPLLVVIYFAMTLRTPVAATFGGALLGLAQDALTHQPLRRLWHRQGVHRLSRGLARRPHRYREASERGWFLPSSSCC